MIESIRHTDLENFRSVIARRFGLQFEDYKAGQLAETLCGRLDAAREEPGRYLAKLDSPDVSQEELRALARDLTVGETYFFRNIDQFRAFSEVALPECRNAQSDHRRLRVLSAGCASGEEAYSLAILVCDGPGFPGWDVRIQGVDINTAVLDKARSARYSPWALRETPPEVRTRRFQTDGRDFVLDPAIRAMVTFEERNLAEDDPVLWQPGAFDIVFCRNVIMYLTPRAAQGVVKRIAGSLSPGGFLFLGHAETLRGLSQDFHLRHTHGTFYYQRREVSEGVSPAPRATRPPPPLDPLSRIDSDASWVATIRRASDRIRTLARPSATATPPWPALPPVAGEGTSRDLARVIDLVGRERFAEAQRILTELPPDSSQTPEALLLTAVLLTHGGDLAEAERACAALLELDEMNVGAHYLMALCREGAGDLSGAADHDRLATYLDPAFAMPRLHLGLLARRASDLANARRELEQALALLQREETSRLLLFAGGFRRETLIKLCCSELASCGGAP